jgi:hypothetical protein
MSVKADVRLGVWVFAMYSQTICLQAHFVIFSELQNSQIDV